MPGFRPPGRRGTRARGSSSGSRIEVEGSHEYIKANYRADLSRSFSSNATIADHSQGPIDAHDNHGQSVAGVAAARGGNGIGDTVANLACPSGAPGTKHRKHTLAEGNANTARSGKAPRSGRHLLSLRLFVPSAESSEEGVRQKRSACSRYL